MNFQNILFLKSHLLKSNFFLCAKIKDLLHKMKFQTENNLLLSKYREKLFSSFVTNWTFWIHESKTQHHINQSSWTSIFKKGDTLDSEIWNAMSWKWSMFQKGQSTNQKKKMSGSNIKSEIWKNKMLHKKQLIIDQ